MKTRPENVCPCTSGLTYPSCCGRWHAGEAAPDAESLMRSRYSAYVLRIADYLIATWHSTTRPAALDLTDPITWVGLGVKKHRIIDGRNAEVEFVARFRVGGGPASRLHERSRFVCEDGRWLYLDGEMNPPGGP